MDGKRVRPQAAVGGHGSAMSTSPFRPQRWNDAVLEHGAELRTFWQHHLAEKRRTVLYILAKGFDPRMCLGIEMLLDIRGKDPIDVDLIEFDEGPNSPSRAYLPSAEQN